MVVRHAGARSWGIEDADTRGEKRCFVVVFFAHNKRKVITYRRLCGRCLASTDRCPFSATLGLSCMGKCTETGPCKTADVCTALRTETGLKVHPKNRKIKTDLPEWKIYRSTFHCSYSSKSFGVCWQRLCTPKAQAQSDWTKTFSAWVRSGLWQGHSNAGIHFKMKYSIAYFGCVFRVGEPPPRFQVHCCIKPVFFHDCTIVWSIQQSYLWRAWPIAVLSTEYSRWAVNRCSSSRGTTSLSAVPPINTNCTATKLLFSYIKQVWCVTEMVSALFHLPWHEGVFASFTVCDQVWQLLKD